MSDEDLKLCGITPGGTRILDTDEKVRRLREELSVAIERDQEKWKWVRRESLRAAYDHILD